LPTTEIAIISPMATRPFRPPEIMLRMPAVVAFQVFGEVVTMSNSQPGIILGAKYSIK
jgi:hypothetical protein